MATASELADSAMKKLHDGLATSISDAVYKAIKGKGITNTVDVNRLHSATCAELGRRGAATKAVIKGSQVLKQKISA